MIAELAQTVTDRINASGLIPDATAVRGYAPEYELSDMQTLHVTVVPKGLAVTAAGRASCQCDCQIDVAVQKRINPEHLDEIDALLELAEHIAAHFRQKPLKDGVTCIRTEHAPIYALEHLRELRQFTSVITLTLRTVTQP